MPSHVDPAWPLTRSFPGGSAASWPQAREPRPAPAAPIGPQIIEIETWTSEGSTRWGYMLRVRALHRGPVVGTGGITCNFPDLTRAICTDAEVHSRNVDGATDTSISHPGSPIWGFTAEQDWRQRPADHLMVEAVRRDWAPGEIATLELVLRLPIRVLKTDLRSWVSVTEGARSRVLVAPRRGQGAVIDQQGFDAQRLVTYAAQTPGA